MENMRNFLSRLWEEQRSAQTIVKSQSPMKPNVVQKFEDNWDCELVVNDRNLKSAQRDKQCVDAQTTCPHESDPKTRTITEKILETATKDMLQKFSKESEGNELDCVNIPAEIQCTDEQGTGSGTGRQDETEDDTRIVKLEEMSITNDSSLDGLDADEMSYFSIEDGSEENGFDCANVPAEVGRTNIDVQETGNGTNRQDESEIRSGVLMDIGTEVNRQDFFEESEGNESDWTNVQKADLGTRIQDESTLKTRLVKLIEINPSNHSLLDDLDEISCFSIEDESGENESRAEIRTNDNRQKFFEEAKGNETNCVKLPTGVDRTDITDEQGTSSGTNRQDASENEATSEVVMKIGKNDNLQNFFEESVGNESTCVNASLEIKRTDVQETGRGRSTLDESVEETRVGKLMEMESNNDSFLNVPDEMSFFPIQNEPEKNESRAEILLEIGTNGNLQKYSEELEANKANCVKIPDEVDRIDVQGTESELSKQDESENENRTDVLMEIEAMDNRQTFSEESGESKTDCVNIFEDVDRTDLQGSGSGTSRQDESEDETHDDAELMEMNANNDSSLLASNEMSYTSSKEIESSCIEVSAEMEQSGVQRVVSKTNSLNDSMAGKRSSGKRQISTPPVRRSSRLKTFGGQE